MSALVSFLLEIQVSLYSCSMPCVKSTAFPKIFKTSRVMILRYMSGSNFLSPLNSRFPMLCFLLVYFHWASIQAWILAHFSDFHKNTRFFIFVFLILQTVLKVLREEWILYPSKAKSYNPAPQQKSFPYFSKLLSHSLSSLLLSFLL